MALSDSSWQDCPDTGIITGSYIVFNQVVPIDHFTNVPVTVSHTSAENNHNASYTALTSLSGFSVLNNEIINKDKYVVSEQAPIITLDSKSYVCMANNGKETKHTRHISSSIHFVINVE